MGHVRIFKVWLQLVDNTFLRHFSNARDRSYKMSSTSFCRTYNKEK